MLERHAEESPKRRAHTSASPTRKLIQFLKYSRSQAVDIAALNSLSAVASAMAFCVRDEEVTVKLFQSTTVPLTDFLVCLHPDQSATRRCPSFGAGKKALADDRNLQNHHPVLDAFQVAGHVNQKFLSSLGGARHVLCALQMSWLRYSITPTADQNTCASSSLKLSVTTSVGNAPTGTGVFLGLTCEMQSICSKRSMCFGCA